MLAGHSGGFFNGFNDYQKKSPDNYLSTGNSFWTVTPAGGYIPFDYTTWRPLIFAVSGEGLIDDAYVQNHFGIRPVINIRSDVTVTGDGTVSTPYRFS